MAIFACGMAKKTLIANPMGYVADAAFGSTGLHWWDAWYGIYAYGFQVYFEASPWATPRHGRWVGLGDDRLLPPP